MDSYSDRYEIVEGKIRDLQEQRKVLVDLVVELFRQVEDLENRLDELYRSCEVEAWFERQCGQTGTECKCCVQPLFAAALFVIDR